VPSNERSADQAGLSSMFRLRMRLWQGRRCEDGENPLDWQAFRASEVDSGESDPGQDPPAEFLRFTADTPDACFGAGAADAFGDVAPAEKVWV
jgi:hypothetical protein